MRIFRLQNEDNLGFLMHKSQYKYNNRPWDLDYGPILKRPCPTLDTGTELQAAVYNKTITFNSKYIFGCATVKDLYTWFTPVDIGWYEANGFHVYLYEVPREHVLLGSNQLAFDSEHVVSKRKLSHKDLRRI
jgi:hypothetical protein